MRRTIQGLVVALVLIGWSCAAWAINNPKTTTESEYSYDERGRTAIQTNKSYDADGVLTEVTVIANEYDERIGKLIAQDHRISDGDGNATGTALYTYEYDALGKRLRQDRLWVNDRDEQTKREVISWTRDSERSKLRETQVFDGADFLVETRYGIVEYDERGKVLGSDESTFDARGNQIRRYLVTMSHDLGRQDGRVLWYFDANDEITQKVEEDWRRNGRGQLVEVFSTYMNGRGEVTQRSTNVRYYDDETNRMIRRVYTFFRADGELIRQQESQLTYGEAGHLLGRTGTWVYFIDPCL